MSAPRPTLGDLPEYCTRADLASLGLGRRAVDAVVAGCAVVVLPGVRRIYVRKQDVVAYLAEHTYRGQGDSVRPP